MLPASIILSARSEQSCSTTARVRVPVVAPQPNDVESLGDSLGQAQIGLASSIALAQFHARADRRGHAAMPANTRKVYCHIYDGLRQ